MAVELPRIHNYRYFDKHEEGDIQDPRSHQQNSFATV
jgi:hypothetical protein